ncbi:Syntaxin-binding protein 6 [Merluccius polli]|uniref:Syntaxin-binding protein 6 n=1 Tax=Merluccius polli TaxID=89951 RepID=A0AA47N0S7_MERPO|nr:Syntaxin-binding protein 6 [Merluccius polli]
MNQGLLKATHDCVTAFQREPEKGQRSNQSEGAPGSHDANVSPGPIRSLVSFDLGMERLKHGISWVGMTWKCMGTLGETRSVTNKKPSQLSLTKVKQFQGSSAFTRRSQWTIDQLRQINGIDPNKDCPEFDLMFDNAFDQWAASSAGEKCTFVQILHHTCQRYTPSRKPEFVNCQAKLMGGKESPGAANCSAVPEPRALLTTVESSASNSRRRRVFLSKMRKEMVVHRGHLLRQGNSILHTAADSVTSAVQKASQALNERGERLGRAEDKTADMMNSAEQFAVTAHKVRPSPPRR